MTKPNEKAAGVLDDTTTALITKRIPIFTPIIPDCKEFSTLAAGLALRGFELARIDTAGRPLFYISRLGQTRVYSSWHDARAFLAQIGGAI